MNIQSPGASVPHPRTDQHPSDATLSGSRAPLTRWRLVLLAVFSLSVAICLGLAFVPGHPSDMGKYKDWTRHITLNGIHEAYSGKYPRTYAIYPPVTLYGYKAAGHWYQGQMDSKFDVGLMKESYELTAALKGVAIVCHLALGVAIFTSVRQWTTMRWATLASAAYTLNPAVLFDVAYWGQPDSVHALWAVAALALAATGKWLPAWAAIALAGLSKPQAWILLPLFVVRELAARNLMRLVVGPTIAVATTVLIILPFILGDRMPQLLSLPREMAGTMPVVSANAHNLWWLIAGGASITHDQVFVAGLSYHLVAAGLIGAVMILALWLGRSAPPQHVFMVAGYQAFGWFCVTTQAHENHAFLAIPLVAIVVPFSRAARWILAAVTLTLFMNLLLHDPLLAPRLAEVLSPETLLRATFINAALNLGILIFWSGWLIRNAIARRSERKLSHGRHNWAQGSRSQWSKAQTS